MTLPTPDPLGSRATPRQLALQSDASIYEALKSGELQALRVIYDRYGEPVYRLGLRMLQNAQDAEDLTQEVFLTLYQRQAYDPSRGSMNGYLMSLTRSRAIDRIRSRRSRWKVFQRLGGEESSLMQTTKTPLEFASLDERSQRVRAALQTLPDTQQRVLELSYYQGMSQSEIAQHLNLPLGTVKTRSRQGLLKLRQTLRELVE